MGKLENKTVIVTGAGQGIGHAICEVFYGEGATLVMLDQDIDLIQSMSVHFNENGVRSLAIKCDVSNEQEVNNAIESTIRHFGGVDILVNNAGIMDDFIPISESSTEHWNKVLGVNLNGPYFATKAVLKTMLPLKKGVILTISSLGGLSGGKAGVAYTASKHGVIGLTKNTAVMYGNDGIRCNAIAPGGVETSIGMKIHPNATGYAKIGPGLKLMPRAGKPEEIARLALFLVSEDSSFINGSVISADAGWSAY